MSRRTPNRNPAEWLFLVLGYPLGRLLMWTGRHLEEAAADLGDEERK